MIGGNAGDTIVLRETKKRELVLEGDPEQQLEFAQKAAASLMKVVKLKKNPVMIRGEQYMEFGDWQTLARFFGATVGIEWTKKLTSPAGQMLGYEARALIYRNGEVISSAEAMCMKEEANWKSRDEFMIRSMAQTRAGSKALRNAFGWVAELAGYKSTPAEEMDGIRAQQSERHIPRPAPVVEVAVEIPPQDVEPGADDITGKSSLDDIKTLLSELGYHPKTIGMANKIVNEITSLDLRVKNYEAVKKALKAKVEEQIGQHE